MAIKVDNLSNLFWDNGSSRFPNTFPHLINGKYFENITPVMTSPVTGWVVLVGDFNYCEYKGELFFLKKDSRISEKKNKWRYILIKDHICTIFKNKANVIISGTLTNADLDKLKDSDFQFTLSVFSNYNHRILLPLNKQIYNWKKHIVPNPPTKIFPDIYAIDNKDFSIFLRQLENNKELLKNVKFEKSNFFTLLGRAKLNKKSHNWKNELVAKIKEFLSDLENEDVILAKFGADYGNSKFLQGKYVITHNSYSLGAHKEEFKQVLNLNLSNLEDIELVSLVDGQKKADNHFKLELKEVPVYESNEEIIGTYIKKLTPRNRISFLNPFSTRAIYERDGILCTWFEQALDLTQTLLYPQKVFFKTKPSLLAKDRWQRNFPIRRKLESYRSCYLYSVRNLNFNYAFHSNPDRINWYEYRGTNFITANEYLTDNSNKQIATNAYRTVNGFYIKKPDYADRAPWKDIKEPLNIGWLIGQFSPWIDDQASYFEAERQFIVKKPFDRLKRIKGLSKLVSRLVQNTDAYEPTAISEERNFDFTLDIFPKLSARARQATQEADFLIGEKLLFTTWGLGAYLLFQPLAVDGYSYNVPTIDKDNALFGKWLSGASWGNWYYWYSLFDEGHYVTSWAKQWMKKGYDNFNPLPYKRFYANQENFKELKTHIKKNTEAYFITETIEFADNPIKSCKAGDIFFSDLDYYFFDYSEARAGQINLSQDVGDWYLHQMSESLENEEIVVYHDIQEGGIAIGKVNVWKAKTTLPEGQFIAEGTTIDSDSSNLNVSWSRVIKITKLWTNKGFNEVINELRNKPAFFFADVIDFTLKDLKGNPYLFDLKGTDFYCFLDAEGRVNLIFKNGERDVKESEKQIYAISTNEAIAKLDKSQWVNQKVNLSIYGQKIDLPIKAFANKIVATIELDTANLERRGAQEALDSHKIEVTHALGKTYYRFDTSKLNTLGTAQFNVFDVERLDIANARASQDYLIKRREFEIGNDAMELGHRQMKFENDMQKAALISNTIIGAIGSVTSFAGIGLGVATGFAKMAKAKSPGAAHRLGTGMMIAGVNQGLGQVSSGISSAYQWMRHAENTAMMNEKIDLQMQKQVLNSYNLDLTYARQKEDYEFNLRRIFNQQSINQTTSRERNLALDDKEEDLKVLSNKADKEIYLEIWTISGKQKEYAAEYHKEYGVDCRVTNTLVPFGNGMQTGVYRMESVELLNLNDRIDLLLIKAIFENGVQIVEWIEHEKVKELIPEDPRIAKLQQQIEEANKRREELEHEKHLLDVKIQELTVAISNSKDEEARLKGEIKEKQKKIDKVQEDLNVVTQQLKYETEKYDSLATGYRNLEEAKATEERLKKLYLDEKNKLAGEKKELEKTKRELTKAKEQLQKTLASVTQNRDSLIGQLNSEKLKYDALESEKRNIEGELGREQEKVSALEREATPLRDLKQWIEEKGNKQAIEQAFEKVNEFETRIMVGDDRWNDKSITGWRLRIADFLWKEDYYKAIEQVLGCENFTSKDKAVECITKHKEGCQGKEELQRELEETKKSLEAVRQIETDLRNQLKTAGGLWEKYGWREIQRRCKFLIVSTGQESNLFPYGALWSEKYKIWVAYQDFNLFYNEDIKCIILKVDKSGDYLRTVPWGIRTWYYNNRATWYSKRINSVAQLDWLLGGSEDWDGKRNLDNNYRYSFLSYWSIVFPYSPIPFIYSYDDDDFVLTGQVEVAQAFKLKLDKQINAGTSLYWYEGGGWYWNNDSDGTLRAVSTYGEYLDVLGLEAEVDEYGYVTGVKTKGS